MLQNGDTPLHKAAMNGHLEVVSKLLSAQTGATNSASRRDRAPHQVQTYHPAGSTDDARCSCALHTCTPDINEFALPLTKCSLISRAIVWSGLWLHRLTASSAGRQGQAAQPDPASVEVSSSSGQEEAVSKLLGAKADANGIIDIQVRPPCRDSLRIMI
jgi:ankyrin repeat protein